MTIVVKKGAQMSAGALHSGLKLEEDPVRLLTWLWTARELGLKSME